MIERSRRSIEEQRAAWSEELQAIMRERGEWAASPKWQARIRQEEKRRIAERMARRKAAADKVREKYKEA